MLVHPGIAESCSSALDWAGSHSEPGSDLPVVALQGADLLQRFAAVSDGRSDQGREHPVAVVLTLVAAAVLGGMRSFTAIAGWVADVPTALLGLLYGHDTDDGPSKTTIWRILTGADPAAVDAAIGGWLLQRVREQQATTPTPDTPDIPDIPETADMPEPAATEAADTGAADTETDDDAGGSGLLAIAVDGKTLRGARDPDGNQVHLMAAATHHDALVLGQVEVGAKSNEIPMFAPLLDTVAGIGVALDTIVITADALHTQRAHAEYLHTQGAHFLLTVKANQPGLFAALDALPWTTTPIAHRDIDPGHGRLTTRTIQVMPAPADLPFPHVEQVWLIERYVNDPTGKPISAVAALGVISLPADRANPADIARLTRRHWTIEVLHWLRDTVYREDNSKARTGSGPRVMASMRNLAIGALHLTGRRDITEATRWAARDMDRPFKILKLKT